MNDALEMIYNRFGREALADIDGGVHRAQSPIGDGLHTCTVTPM